MGARVVVVEDICDLDAVDPEVIALVVEHEPAIGVAAEGTSELLCDTFGLFVYAEARRL